MNLKLKSRYDDEKVCENPDKGWYVHYYDNGITKYGDSLAKDDFLEDFPLMDHIYLRLAWSYLEPEEGKFNWEIIDKIIDPWVAHGYRIAFRITCKETGKDQAYATPKWVFDAGAAYKMVNDICEPDYGDPIFLKKLENFHRAFAERYDSRPEVIYIDIGSYGDWGEFHTCSSSHRDWPSSVIVEHMKIHTRCYKHTQLVISDDVIGSREIEEGKDRIMQFIEDNGITIRDDGVSVKWFKDHYGYNTLRSGPIYDRVWRDYPTILELEHYPTTKKTGSYMGGWPFLASVQESHATYAGFHGDPRPWLEENPEMAVMLGNQLGYWYFLYAVDLPDKIDSGRFEINCYWENKGAARAYKKYRLDFKLSGQSGEYTCTADKFDNIEMMPHTITVRPHMLDFGDVPQGRYQLSCRMYNDEGRTIEIGMDNKYRSDDGFYDITEITVG